MRCVLTRIVSCSERCTSAEALWPVPWAATRRPRSRAKFTTATTSATGSGSAPGGGRGPPARLHARRASSQPASPGTVTAPVSCSRSVPASRPAEVVLYILESPQEVGSGGEDPDGGPFRRPRGRLPSTGAENPTGHTFLGAP